MKALLFSAIVVFILAGCSTKDSFTVKGKIEGNSHDVIYMNLRDVDVAVLIDSAKIGKDGSFRFRVKSTEPDFYQVGFSASDFVTILAEPGEKINLSFSGKTLYESPKVTGSEGTAKMFKLDSALAVTTKRIDSLKAEYEKWYGKEGFVEKEKEINDSFVKILKSQRMYNMDFILKNLRSFASIKALYQKIDESTYVLYDVRDLQFLKLVSDTLSKFYPNSKQVKSLKSNFEQEKNRMVINTIDRMAQDAPETKLDASLPDMNGNRITLSSLRGKHVLLTFWSAASRDCIAENLELKALYSKYKNKGFEIYQVNLDSSEETWRRAVKFDELPWISVREDDPTNPRTAILFNVKILPANYLYDAKGNIVASNLHGKQLAIKLSQIFGN